MSGCWGYGVDLGGAWLPPDGDGDGSSINEFFMQRARQTIDKCQCPVLGKTLGFPCSNYLYFDNFKKVHKKKIWKTALIS